GSAIGARTLHIIPTFDETERYAYPCDKYNPDRQVRDRRMNWMLLSGSGQPLIQVGWHLFALIK
ncbi:MAG: hypothetical protein OEU36_04610, partial [Gammaproteobacteria bacterium]|nr:hypothetical protein [Gammaproteobacteria bacterium]